MSDYEENSNFMNIVNTVKEAVPTLSDVYNNISNLDSRIDSITFDSNNQLYQFFGTFRYLTGDIIYLTSFSIISLIVSFYAFKVLKRFVNFVLQFIPFANIKIP